MFYLFFCVQFLHQTHFLIINHCNTCLSSIFNKHIRIIHIYCFFFFFWDTQPRLFPSSTYISQTHISKNIQTKKKVVKKNHFTERFEIILDKLSSIPFHKPGRRLFKQQRYIYKWTKRLSSQMMMVCTLRCLCNIRIQIRWRK